MKIRRESILKILNFAVIAFIIIRLGLNLPAISEPLGMFFTASYLLLLALFVKRDYLFLPVFIVFLSIDSMFGTYFFAREKLGEIEYFGTMAVNLIFIIMALWLERRMSKNRTDF